MSRGNVGDAPGVFDGYQPFQPAQSPGNSHGSNRNPNQPVSTHSVTPSHGTQAVDVSPIQGPSSFQVLGQPSSSHLPGTNYLRVHQFRPLSFWNPNTRSVEANQSHGLSDINQMQSEVMHPQAHNAVPRSIEVLQQQLPASSEAFASNLSSLVSSLTSHIKSSSVPPSLVWTRPISVEQSNAEFIEQHPNPSNPRKRPGGGRPRLPDEKLKRPRLGTRTKPTRLLARNPVNTEVPSDVWAHIFHFTDYRTVMSLRRTCKDFHFTSSREGFWKRYLEENLKVPGLKQETPSLPPGLTYMQFADLLLGQGCMGCGAMKTKKVQWAFYRRWCKSCFSEKTITGHEAQSITHEHGPLLECLPAADIDPWKNYSKVALNRPLPSLRGQVEWKYYAVTKKDLTRIVNDCENFLASLPPNLDDEERNKRLSEWRTEKSLKAKEERAIAKVCQDFAKERQWRLDCFVLSNSRSYRTERAKFFKVKAKQLDPPLSADALTKIPGYLKSLEVRRPPTDRSWGELMQKIDLYRAEAEEEAAAWTARLDEADLKSQPQSEASKKAQKLLMDIADEYLKGLDVSKIAAEDFAYLFLREIHRRYYELPLDKVPSYGEDDVVRPNDGSSRYALNIDDAWSIYGKKLAAYIEEYMDAESRKKVWHYYCPGCTRTDYRRKFTFIGLLDHIVSVHSTDLSSPFRYFAPKDRKYRSRWTTHYPWRSVPWPRNLPLLPPHQKATGNWDPDDETYECAPPHATSNLSAFDLRVVRPRIPKSGNVTQHVIDAILEAAELLRESPMPEPYRARIAWNYAIQSKAQCLSSRPLNPADVDQISAALIRAGEFSIFSKVACAPCVDGKIPRSHKFAEVKHTFEAVTNHWKNEHQKPRNPASVETELLHLPSGTELAVELEKDAPGMEQTRTAFDYLFPLVDSEAAHGSTGSAASSGKEATMTSEAPLTNPKRTRRSQRSEIDALNVLAEEAARIDPRLRCASGEASNTGDVRISRQDGEPQATSALPESPESTTAAQASSARSLWNPMPFDSSMGQAPDNGGR